MTPEYKAKAGEETNLKTYMHLSVHSGIIYNSQIGKPSKCSSADKEIKKKVSGILFTLQKNENLPFATMWMNLESFMLSEINQRQLFYVITYTWNLKDKTNRYIYNKTETGSQIKKIS